MAEETVYIRGENGLVMEHRLPLPDGVAHRLAKGYLQQVNADGSPLSDQPAAPDRPAKTASKTDWVAYAVAVDPDLAPDDADAMTKADLVDKYGK